MAISRRRFLQGSVAIASLAVGADRLRFFEPLAPASMDPALAGAVAAAVFRTAHSNNCDGGCGHLVQVTNGRVTMVEQGGWEKTTIAGEPTPLYLPRTCLRGLVQAQNTYSPDRLKYPYRRIGPRGSGKWERISWEEATTEIARNFQQIQSEHGPLSLWISPYTGSLSLIEGVVGAGIRLATVLGASAGDWVGDNEGDSATPAGWNYVLVDPENPKNAGGLFDGHEATDFRNSRVIVLWGNNVAETSIPDWRIMSDARDNGTRVISIDPRYTPTSAGADSWIPIRPGSDTALIDAVIKYVIDNKKYDEGYVRQYTVAPYLVHPVTRKWLRHRDAVPGGTDDYMVVDEFDGRLKSAGDPSLRKAALFGTHSVGGLSSRTALQVLADTVAKYTPDYTEKVTDVPRNLIADLAQMWGREHPIAVRAGFALSHWYHGDLTMQALLTLQALTGNIGVHGGGVTTFAGGLTTTSFDLANWWSPNGKPLTVLEPMEACDAMLDGKPYPVRAAWFMVNNYAQQMSDRNKVVEALKSLDYLVVSDYVMSATADLADIVLPASTYLEKTDLLSSVNFYLQYMPKVIDPLWESKSDLDAIRMVATKMGVGQYFDKTPDDYLQELLHIGDPEADANVRGLDWEQLTKNTVHPGATAVSDVEQLPTGAFHLNTPTVPYVPFYNKEFPTKSGKIEFYVEMLVPYDQEVCDHKEPVEASPGNPAFRQYPLVFLSTHTRFRTHSQYANLPSLNEINNGGMGFLEINPRDAGPRGIRNGDVVRVFNERGEMKVHARLTEGIKPGVVNCYQGGWDTVRVKHYVEGHPNNLTHQKAKPAQALIPNFRNNAAYYDCLVQVEKHGGGT